jgi:hypothetical protein
VPSRKSVWPGNAKRDRRREVKPQAVFGEVYEDCPPTSVPETALAKAINGWPQGTSWRPRNGTKPYGIQYPPLTGRTGYAAHKVGNLIISDSGNIFTQADVSNIWVWDNNLTDEMTVYVDAQTMQCRDDDYNTGTDCHIQGKVNLNKWHDRAERWIVLLGNEIWTANREKTVYLKVLVFSANLPANALSEMIEDGDDAIIQNSRYMYHLLLSETPVRAYAKSTPVPSVRIISNDDAGERRHKYHFIYACALLSQGPGNFYHRETQQNGVYVTKIHTESGTNQIDENLRDWAVINTLTAIGPRDEQYGRIIGGTLLAPFDAPGGWTGISDITFQAELNNLGRQECIADGTLVADMPELASRIQDALRVYFPAAECEFVSTVDIGPHFVISTGLIKGGTIEPILEGITGTPSAANLGLTAAAGADIQNPYVGVPKVIRNLYLPRVQYTSALEYQRHWSHFPIYRSADIGPGGVSDDDRKGSVYYSHLNVKGKRIVNSPDELIWEKDLRVAGSFIARRYYGYIQLRSDELGGELELADEGSVMEFEDGSRTQIATFINPKLAKYSIAGDAYYGGVSEWMAACIGNGRAVRVEQTGAIIRRIPGSHTDSYTAFTAADERKMVWFPNGVRDWIKRFIDADTVEMYVSQDRTVTGLTLDPRYRAYNSAVYDDELFERSSNWLCKNRFMREVLPSNLISSQPGFFIMAARGGKEVRYCPTNPGYKYFVGYHNREYQTIKLEDVIERMAGFPNRYSALCKGSLHTGATNNSIEYTIPETFQKIFILSGMEQISKIGIISYGSMDWIDDEWIRFITNTGELRDFNGLQFRMGPDGDAQDYAEDRARGLGRFSKALKKAYKEFNSIYARGVGFIQWWKNIED